MNTMVGIDTLKYAKKLMSSGYTQEQAEGAAEALSEALYETVVSPAYLDKKIAEVDIKISDSKAEILKWMFSAMAVQAGIIIAVIKFL